MIVGYTASLTINSTYRWADTNLYNMAYYWKDINFYNPELTTSLLLIYMIIYGVHIYLEKSIAIKEHIIKTEKLEKENAIAQYMSLKAQIEPHFLFNSLSVLSGIVHTNPDLASDFIIKLSKTLRYIIEQNENKLVPLKEELTIVNDYFFLLKTRFNSAIVLENNINKDIIKNSYIPPATLQMLIENAVQHNKLSEKYPLVVSFSNNSNYIIIENRIQRKDNQSTSTGKGLLNIRKRYDLITMREVTITEYDNMFTVKIPILRKSDYERINN
jgi:LytS/YehU family sensor histidine kinase